MSTLLRKDNLRHLNSVTHEGKLVIVATDDAARLWYTVRQDGYEDSYLRIPVDQRTGFEAWKALELPDQDDDPSVLEQEVAELSVAAPSTRQLQRSVYRSKSLSALAPVQLVSALGHVYVFRQSTAGTLLVDRFVLDGMTNQLNPKLQVRYKRSRQKNRPLQSMRKGVQGLEDVDTLDFTDANGQPFFEPSIELPMIDGLQDGWFAVVLVPTTENDVHRWHVFAYNRTAQTVDLVTLRASDEGLFAWTDWRPYDPTGSVPVGAPVPGLIRRQFTFAQGANRLNVTQGLAATRFDLQQEQAAQSGEMQLVKTASKLMLAVPTHAGIATVNFAIAADGTLSELATTPTLDTLRSTRREVMLPLDTLEAIKAYADASPPATGAITGFGRSIDRGSEDLIEVQTAPGAAAGLSDGDSVTLGGTQLFEGRHSVAATLDGDHFDIEVDAGASLGRWAQQEDARSGLVFDGMIASYELTADGRLRITCPGHGLAPGDEVQILGATGLDGRYGVRRVDDQRFVVDGRWVVAEAVNLRLVSRKRRGIVLDGVGDFITIPAAEALTMGATQDFTLEVWVKVGAQADAASARDFVFKMSAVGTLGYGYALSYLPASRQIAVQLDYGFSALQVASVGTIDDGAFHHVALVKAGTQLRLYLDGDLARGATSTIDLSGGQASQITNTNGSLYLGHGLGDDNYFKGQLADLRLWKTARSTAELRQHMSLAPTGLEAGLVGCWRLAAVTEGKVIDGSVHRNDGVVHGHAHVSAVQLARQLDSGLPAFKYGNDELVAVSQRSTYVESFEFRLDPPPADASGAEVFRFVHWGRASRHSDERIAAGDATFQNPVEALADDPGWYRASARVTIPDGMALLRSFEVEVVPDAPAWQSAEIRRHRLEGLSGSISLSTAAAPLALRATPTVDALGALATLASLEQQEAALWLEQRRLVRALAEQVKPGALDAAKAAEQSARSARDAAQVTLDAEVANPLNYWCRIRGAVWNYADDHWTAVTLDTGSLIALMTRLGNSPVQEWKFVKVDADHYEIVCRSQPDRPCTYVAMSDTDLRIELKPRDPGNTVQKWLLGTPAGMSSGVYCISPLWWPDCVCQIVHFLGKDYVTMRPVPPAGRPGAPWCQWIPEKVGDEHANTVIETCQAEHDRLYAIWSRADRALRDLQSNAATLTARLAAVNAELARLRGAAVLPAANRNGLLAIDGARRAPLAGTVVFSDAARGLESSATLLGAARPASRLSALADCEGNVQLNYFDRRGCMRRTRYDAVADSRNAAFEQWLPDGPRACLSFGNNDVLLVDIDIATTPGWTIEAWFSFPLPDLGPGAFNVLASGQSPGNQPSAHALVDAEGRLGIVRDKNFVAVGFDMDLLEPGWHHLAAVGQADTTVFYIDGARVGDTKQALAQARDAAKKELDESQKAVDALDANAPQQAVLRANYRRDVAAAAVKALVAGQPTVTERLQCLGGLPNGAQSFGKLAELRVWGAALDADEIAANSKTLLSGNEPDLLACFPLDEGSGTQVRDLTGRSAPIDLKFTPTWWGCTAAIGHVGPTGGRALQFDGSGQCVEVPYAAELNPAQFTVACWARVTGGQGSWRSVITSRNVGPTRGYIVYAGQNNKWQFWVGDGSAGAWAICSGSDAASDVVPYRWTHLAASFDGTRLVFYIDGIAVASAAGRYATNGPANGRPLRIGGGTTENSLVRYPFTGQIAELCLWNRALDPLEVARGMNQRRRGADAGLVARWPLDQTTSDAARAQDVIGGRHGQVVKGATLDDDRWLPIVPDALLCEEYSTVGAGSRGNVAMMRRFMGYPARDGALVLPQQRIELLELKWLGNAQFAPTLLGYIEGAPPVPSENLTMADDYNGAASVELTTSDDIEYKWTRAQDSGLGGSVDAFLGGGGKVSVVAAPLGVGTEIETSTKVGFKGNLDFNYQFQNESSVAASSSLATTDRIELRGTPELRPKFPHLGNRFIPKNVGYALVVSALADVFITRLARSKRMIGYQVKPVEGLPPDVNTITFMMNPAYVMNGSLDGLTGSAATSERYFKQVPQMRAEFGSLYPASYYRLREAYDLKTQIEKADKQRESYFANFDVGMVDQLSLDRHIDDGAAPGAVTTRPDVPATGGTETKSAEQTGKDFAAGADAAASETGDAAGKRNDEIKQRIDDLGKQTHAAVAFAAWQVKMEDLRIRAGKRNIVNTYVWDADGGLRTESQSFANTVEHNIGGSFALNAGLGVEAEFEAGISVELTAQATVNMTQTMTKTASTSKGLELAVDLGGLEFRGITDYEDNPILPGEKVDRYRFMSFYLEGSDQNFQDFFGTVVDPQWLASNDEEARALRQARAGKPNKAWRVLHRVTYVERPALMGFGSARRTVNAAETSDYQLMLDKVTRLEDTLNKLLAAKGL